MKNTHWIKIIREINPHRKVAELLTESKLNELKKEDRTIEDFTKINLEERTLDFDLWFSWN